MKKYLLPCLLILSLSLLFLPVPYTYQLCTAPLHEGAPSTCFSKTRIFYGAHYLTQKFLLNGAWLDGQTWSYLPYYSMPPSHIGIWLIVSLSFSILVFFAYLIFTKRTTHPPHVPKISFRNDA